MYCGTEKVIPKNFRDCGRGERPILKCSASKARPKNGIRYITNPKKAEIVSVRNLFEDEGYAKQFEETARRFCKGEKYEERKLSFQGMVRKAR